MLLVADNVINTYNYLPAIYKLVLVFAVKVSRPYFSTSPQGTCEKFGQGTRTAMDFLVVLQYLYGSVKFLNILGCPDLSQLIQCLKSQVTNIPSVLAHVLVVLLLILSHCMHTPTYTHSSP